MKKKHVFTAIIIFFVGLVIGVIFTFFIAQDKNDSLFLSIISAYLGACYVGIFSAIFYFELVVAFGICIVGKCFLAKIERGFVNLIAIMFLWFCTDIVCNSKSENHLYYSLILLLFTIAVVGKANYDGMVLRKSREK